MGREKKGQLEWNTLVPWIIAIGVLVLMFFAYQILYGKGGGALNYLRDFFRFGR